MVTNRSNFDLVVIGWTFTEKETRKKRKKNGVHVGFRAIECSENESFLPCAAAVAIVMRRTFKIMYRGIIFSCWCCESTKGLDEYKSCFVSC